MHFNLHHTLNSHGRSGVKVCFQSGVWLPFDLCPLKDLNHFLEHSWKYQSSLRPSVEQYRFLPLSMRSQDHRAHTLHDILYEMKEIIWQRTSEQFWQKDIIDMENVMIYSLSILNSPGLTPKVFSTKWVVQNMIKTNCTKNMIVAK